MEEIVLITEELLEAGRSAEGGWTKAQLECIGVSWPPPKGWKKAMIGRSIEKQKLEEFYSRKAVDQLSLFD